MISELQKLSHKHVEKTPFIVKYPKFMLLLLTFVMAYFLFYERNSLPFHDYIISFGYFGAFIAGTLYTYGFTAAPATAIFLILDGHQNIFLASLIGGVGALLSDILIFRFITHSFKDEIEKLSQEKPVMFIVNLIPKRMMKYIVPLFAGLIIASPIPDEIGVTLLATTKLSNKMFILIDFCCNVIGIFAILSIARAFT